MLWPRDVVQHIRIQAFETSSEPICLFDNAWPGDRFAGYLYISPKLDVLEFLIDLIAGQKYNLDVSLRPLTSAEFIWRSLRRRLFRQPRDVLLSYFRPSEPFLISFSFPGQRRFSSEDRAYQWWIDKREPASVEGASFGQYGAFE